MPQVFVECFYLLIQSILFTCIVYFSAGFEKVRLGIGAWLAGSAVGRHLS